MNDPAQLLSLFLNGALGRSGRKRARKASKFLTGHRGLVTSSAVLAAAGVAWGIYDSLKAGAAGASGAAGAPGAVPGGSPVAPQPLPPPLPGAAAMATVGTAAPAGTAMPAEVLRIVRLAVSAARADGALTGPERALILEQARKAGVEAAAEQELDRPHPLADIVRGVTDERARHDLYILAFTIVRADEAVTGGERIYLAQLAHQLGIDPATAARLESEASAGIDSAANA
ncbi:MAG: DUF533 domain-containing protein [Acidobacteria bacterium]|nr:DUF533 domain-containing protein [Acidobacteriota bacterium]